MRRGVFTGFYYNGNITAQSIIFGQVPTNGNILNPNKGTTVLQCGDFSDANFRGVFIQADYEI